MDTTKPPEMPPSIERERQARKAPPPEAVTTRVFVAPVGGVVEGRAYWLDGQLVIADATVGVGAQFHALTGTVEYDKVHEEAWLEGDPIYWVALGGCLSNAATHTAPGSAVTSAGVKVGVADKDAPRPSATGHVRLDAIPATP